MSRSLGSRLFTTRVADRDFPGGDLLEAGDHAQQRRLAAAGRPDDDDELAVGDLDIDAEDHFERAVALADVAEADVGHLPILV